MARVVPLGSGELGGREEVEDCGGAGREAAVRDEREGGFVRVLEGEGVGVLLVG